MDARGSVFCGDDAHAATKTNSMQEPNAVRRGLEEPESRRWLGGHAPGMSEYQNHAEHGHESHEPEELGRIILDGSMPPSRYLLMHPEARLTEAERVLLAEGLMRTAEASPAVEEGSHEDDHEHPEGEGSHEGDAGHEEENHEEHEEEGEGSDANE